MEEETAFCVIINPASQSSTRVFGGGEGGGEGRGGREMNLKIGSPSSLFHNFLLLSFCLEQGVEARERSLRLSLTLNFATTTYIVRCGSTFTAGLPDEMAQPVHKSK